MHQLRSRAITVSSVCHNGAKNKQISKHNAEKMAPAWPANSLANCVQPLFVRACMQVRACKCVHASACVQVVHAVWPRGVARSKGCGYRTRFITHSASQLHALTRWSPIAPSEAAMLAE
jgi:hypothetical protein